MTSKVFQYNQKVPIGLVGGTPVYASWDFLKYLEEQRTRSGGNTAMTNLELEALSSDQADAIAAALAQANAAMAAAMAAQNDATQALDDTAVLFSRTPVYMQETEPTTVPCIWFKTNAEGTVIDIMQVT